MKYEDRFQMDAMNYLRLKYPTLGKLAWHIANERKTSRARGAKLKRMGVLAGVPDIVIAYPYGGYHGLYIELKAMKLTGITDDGTANWVRDTYPKPHQKEILQELHEVGYAVDVCWNMEEFRHTVTEYLDGTFSNSEYFRKHVLGVV
jgi:hypothetical protein